MGISSACLAHSTDSTINRKLHCDIPGQAVKWAPEAAVLPSRACLPPLAPRVSWEEERAWVYHMGRLPWAKLSGGHQTLHCLTWIT